MAFETISEKPFTQQELLNRKLHIANGKLSTASEMSSLYALFCILATVDLNINPGEGSPPLLMAFIVNTSFLVVLTVLVKIAIMYITPRLETAVFMSRYDIKEFDQILHDEIIFFMDKIWIFSSLGCTFMFGLNFIFICWIKFKHISVTSATAATAIMAPTVVLTMLFAAFSYFRIKKRNLKTLLNEDEISTGSPKVHYHYHHYSKHIHHNNSHVANSRWDLVKAHVYNKSHVV